MAPHKVDLFFNCSDSESLTLSLSDEQYKQFIGKFELFSINDNENAFFDYRAPESDSVMFISLNSIRMAVFDKF
jgi:hypothetical protein